MTNLEKWQQKFAEAKDGHELLETIYEMHMTHTKRCFEIGTDPCNQYIDCEECKAKWLNEEAEEGE